MQEQGIDWLSIGRGSVFLLLLYVIWWWAFFHDLQEKQAADSYGCFVQEDKNDLQVVADTEELEVVADSEAEDVDVDVVVKEDTSLMILMH